MPDFTRAIIKSKSPQLTCRYGHVLTLASTFLTHKGYLGCRQCKLEEKRRYRSKKRSQISQYNSEYYLRRKAQPK